MSSRSSLSSRTLRPIVQMSGFARKELTAIVRQPLLLLVLVAGPFLVLFLFAVGFDQQQTVLDTKFVAPDGSVYEESIAEFDDELGQYVNNAGFTSDLIAAEEELSNGDVDLVVIFPDDPTGSVLTGEQAVIKVLHNKIDPIQQVTVDVSTQVAVQELNAAILERVVGEAQTALVPYETSLDNSLTSVAALSSAVDRNDTEEVTRLTAELESSTSDLVAIVDVTNSVVSELRGGDEQRARLEELSTSVDEFEGAVAELATTSDEINADDVAAVQQLVTDVEANGESLHEKVVAALDAGSDTGFEEVLLATVEDE